MDEKQDLVRKRPAACPVATENIHPLEKPRGVGARNLLWKKSATRRKRRVFLIYCQRDGTNISGEVLV